MATKGLVPTILGVALENGAINRDVSGTTLTFRATPIGIIKALASQGLPDLYADYASSGVQRFASRFSASASFDTSRGPAAGTFTADDHQLSAWSARYEVINSRDPAGPQYVALWKGIATDSAAYQSAVATLNSGLAGWREFTEWQTALTGQVSSKVDGPLAKD